MKKLWIMSIIALAAVCLLAVGVVASDDITATGLIIDSADDAGTYIAGEGTVTVSFDSDSNTYNVEVTNASINTTNDYALMFGNDPYIGGGKAVVTFYGTNTLCANDSPLHNSYMPVTYMGVEGSKIILESNDDGIYSIGNVNDENIAIKNCDIEITAPYDIWTNNSDVVLNIENSKITGQSSLNAFKLIVKNSDISIPEIIVRRTPEIPAGTLYVLDMLKIFTGVDCDTVGEARALMRNFEGKLTGDGTVLIECHAPDNCGDDRDDHYHEFYTNGKEVTDKTEKEVNHRINPFFLFLYMKRAMQEYTVTLTASEGGSITGDEVVRWSRSAVYTITPDEGWTLVSLCLDGEEIEPTLTLELERVKSDRKIEAIFAPIEK